MKIYDCKLRCHKYSIFGIANGQTRAHEHPFYELALPLRGTSIVVSDKCSYTIKPGNVLLISQGTRHYEKRIKDEGNKIAYIDFSFEEQIPEEFREMLDDVIDISHIYKEIKNNFDKIQREIHENLPDADFIIELNLKEVLIMIRRCFKPEDLRYKEDGNKLSGRQIRMIEAAANELRTNLGQQIQIAELAEMFYLSPAYFSTIFRQHFGISPVKYLNQARMNKAIELLKTTTLSQEKIARAVGYLDAAYLCKQFRKKYNKTPGTFR